MPIETEDLEEKWQESLLKYNGHRSVVAYIRSTLGSDYHLTRCPSTRMMQQLLTLACISQHCNVLDDLNGSDDRPLNMMALDVLYFVLNYVSVKPQSGVQPKSSLLRTPKPEESEILRIRNRLFDLVMPLVSPCDEMSGNRATWGSRKRQIQTKLTFGAAPLPIEGEFTPENSPKKKLKPDLELTPGQREVADLIREIKNGQEADKEEPLSLWDTGNAGQAHDTVLGYKALHVALKGNIWRAIIVALMCASTSDLRSQACWKTWNPVLTFVVQVMKLQLDTVRTTSDLVFLNQTVKQDSLIGELVRSLNIFSADRAIQTFVERAFAVVDDDILPLKHVYDQELKTSKQFLLKAELGPLNTFPLNPQWSNNVKLGFESIPLRRELLSLLYDYHDILFRSSKSPTEVFNLKSEKLLNETVKKLVLAKYMELEEFFTVEPTETSQTKFLAALAVELIETFCGARLEFNGELGLTELLEWQEEAEFINQSLTDDPNVQGSFSFYFESTSKVTLLFQFLISMELLKERFLDEPKVLNSLQKGDKRRIEMVDNQFNNVCKTTLKERERYSPETHRYLKLEGLSNLDNNLQFFLHH